MWSRTEGISAVMVAAGVALGLAAGPGPVPHAAASTPGPQVSFADDIAPIFQARCVECHGSVQDGEVRAEASLKLTSYDDVMAGSEYGPVVEPGNPDDSMIVVLIESGDMPEEGDPVPAEELEKIRTWIAEGAPNN